MAATSGTERARRWERAWEIARRLGDMKKKQARFEFGQLAADAMRLEDPGERAAELDVVAQVATALRQQKVDLWGQK